MHMLYMTHSAGEAAKFDDAGTVLSPSILLPAVTDLRVQINTKKTGLRLLEKIFTSLRVSFSTHKCKWGQPFDAIWQIAM